MSVLDVRNRGQMSRIILASRKSLELTGTGQSSLPQGRSKPFLRHVKKPIEPVQPFVFA